MNKKAFKNKSSSRSVSVRDIMLFLFRPILRTATLRNDEAGVKAFTLIELLVVVLIIGILAAIALPQYQKAVDKSRVATILPLMRRWADALALYKIEHGSYLNGYTSPSADDLGVSWPEDWECSSTSGNTECWSDLWSCFPNEDGTGYVYCESMWKETGKNFSITITQPDDSPAGKRYCARNESFCKSLGGKEIAGYPGKYEF